MSESFSFFYLEGIPKEIFPMVSEVVPSHTREVWKFFLRF